MEKGNKKDKDKFTDAFKDLRENLSKKEETIKQIGVANKKLEAKVNFLGKYLESNKELEPTLKLLGKYLDSEEPKNLKAKKKSSKSERLYEQRGLINTLDDEIATTYNLKQPQHQTATILVEQEPLSLIHNKPIIKIAQAYARINALHNDNSGVVLDKEEKVEDFVTASLREAKPLTQDDSNEHKEAKLLPKLWTEGTPQYRVISSLATEVDKIMKKNGAIRSDEFYEEDFIDIYKFMLHKGLDTTGIQDSSLSDMVRTLMSNHGFIRMEDEREYDRMFFTIMDKLTERIWEHNVKEAEVNHPEIKIPPENLIIPTNESDTLIIIRPDKIPESPKPLKDSQKIININQNNKAVEIENNKIKNTLSNREARARESLTDTKYLETVNRMKKSYEEKERLKDAEFIANLWQHPSMFEGDPNYRIPSLYEPTKLQYVDEDENITSGYPWANFNARLQVAKESLDEEEGDAYSLSDIDEGLEDIDEGLPDEGLPLSSIEDEEPIDEENINNQLVSVAEQINNARIPGIHPPKNLWDKLEKTLAKLNYESKLPSIHLNKSILDKIDYALDKLNKKDFPIETTRKPKRGRDRFNIKSIFQNAQDIEPEKKRSKRSTSRKKTNKKR